jgi:hypothetical protein
MARANARVVLCGSCAFSKRIEHRVRTLRRDEVLRTLAAWKFALYETMRLVFAVSAGVETADHAGDRHRAIRVRDHQCLIRRADRFLIERFEAFAGPAHGARRSCRPREYRHRKRASAAEFGEQEIW